MADRPVAQHVLAQAIDVLETAYGAAPELHADRTAFGERMHVERWRLRWDAAGERWQAYGSTLKLLGDSAAGWIRRQAGEQISTPRVQRLPAKGGDRG